MSRKAFTLIELLVVIAIIALLLSIIMPALGKVKQKAASIVCLANVKGLSEAWHVYLTDNHEYMVPAHVPRNTNRDEGVTYWVETPQDDAGSIMGDPDQVTKEYELNGIRAGALYPYVNDVKAYHCPADKSAKVFGDPDGSWRNSYSINALMNGRIIDQADLKEMVVSRSTKVSNPSSKVVFVEAMDARRWLMGSWLFGCGSDPYWMDVVAIRHGDRSSLGYADGHVETRRWVDESTIANAEAGQVDVERPDTSESGDDIQFMNKAIKPGK